MNRNSFWQLGAVAVCVAAVGLVAGCRDHMPHSFTWPAGGDIQQTHAKPPEGGYYKDWDPYSATLEVTPVTDTNPVRTQHVLIATVKDMDGNPLPNRRVEWMIPKGKSVGTFVEVDESGWRASRGYKVDNNYAVSHTNNFDHVLTRGTDDPSDDVHLTKGQTWAVITSAEEGSTHVIAYAPGIYNWQKHKVFVIKHWRDIAYEWPPTATNPIGTTHKFTTMVKRHSDGAPLQGYDVTYKVVSGPDAVFAESRKDTATVTTGADGNATVTLRQAKPQAGTNRIDISVTKKENGETIQLATGETAKTWIAPQIAITKSAPATARLNEEFDYSITVRNPSNVDATNVKMTDTLPQGVQYVSSNPKAQAQGRQLNWSLGTLAGGASRSATVTVKAPRTGTYENVVRVTADHGLSDEARATTKVAAAILAISKSGPDQARDCEPISFTIEVSNNGDAPAQNVMVTDRLPDGLTWKGEKAVRFDVGTLQPGASKTMRFDATAARAGRFTNTATATASNSDEVKDSATVTVQSANLTLAKDGPNNEFIGRRITYTLTARNTGKAEARNAVLTDMLPNGASFVSASDNGQQSGGNVTWNLGTMAPGASKKVTVVVRGDQIGTLTNRARLTSDCGEAEAQATTEVRGIAAILLEMVDERDPIRVGDNEVYTITVTNQGSAVDEDIVITCTLPAQQSFVSADGPTKATTQGKKVTFAALGALRPKAQAVYKVTVKAEAEGDVRFRVSMKSKEIGEPVEETEATKQYASD